MNSQEVHIMGQSYSLSCPEGFEQRLQQAVQKVDAAMCKIRDAGKIKARERIAVLAALNIAFDEASEEQPPVVAAPEPGTAGGDDRYQALGQRTQQIHEKLEQALSRDGHLL